MVLDCSSGQMEAATRDTTGSIVLAATESYIMLMETSTKANG